MPSSRGLSFAQLLDWGACTSARVVGSPRIGDFDACAVELVLHICRVPAGSGGGVRGGASCSAVIFQRLAVSPFPVTASFGEENWLSLLTRASSLVPIPVQGWRTLLLIVESAVGREAW